MAPSSLTPMLTVEDAVAPVDVYCEAFGAVERVRFRAQVVAGTVEDQAGSAGEGGRAALTRVVAPRCLASNDVVGRPPGTRCQSE